MPGVVTVACKWPNGLILRLFDMVKTREPMLGGGWVEVERAQARPGKMIIINGPAQPWGETAKHLEGGYAFTYNVDADFFAEWLKQNAEADYVKNRLIFAFPKEADAVVEARKMEKVRTGVERIDPDAPPGEFRRAQRRGDGTGIGAITPDTGTLV